MTPPTTLEEALEAVERDADAAIRSLGAALKAARKAKSAAATGQIRDLQQSLENAAGLAGQAVERGRRPAPGWRFDVGEWFTSGEFAKELLASAAEAGVQAFESDERILCYPVIVQVSAADATVVVDKQKDRRIRPSVLARHLAEWQQRPPKFKAEAFIESLARRLRLCGGATWACGQGRRPSWSTCTGCSPCSPVPPATTPARSSPGTCTCSTRAAWSIVKDGRR